MTTYTTHNDQFVALNVAVLIPTYNNATTIGAVLKDVLSYTTHVIVVNDGSTDNTSEILNNFPQIQRVEYAKNRGKGLALRRGFKFAVRQGYDYVITIDSDGQHFASDLPLFLSSIQPVVANPAIPTGNNRFNVISGSIFIMPTSSRI